MAQCAFEEVAGNPLETKDRDFSLCGDFLVSFACAQRASPPESGGQHDRDEVEIVRGEVPEPHDYKVCFGTSPRATLAGRAALLTQEGVAKAATPGHRWFANPFPLRCGKPCGIPLKGCESL